MPLWSSRGQPSWPGLRRSKGVEIGAISLHFPPYNASARKLFVTERSYVSIEIVHANRLVRGLQERAAIYSSAKLFPTTTFAYLALFPGLGSFQGWLGWSQEGRYQAEVDAAEQRYAPLFAAYAEQDFDTLIAEPSEYAFERKIGEF